MFMRPFRYSSLFSSFYRDTIGDPICLPAFLAFKIAVIPGEQIKRNWTNERGGNVQKEREKQTSTHTTEHSQIPVIHDHNLSRAASFPIR